MPAYTIYNDDPTKSTAKILDVIDRPTRQAAAAHYWQFHADYWQGRVDAADAGDVQEEKDYTRRKRQQWAEDRSRRQLWIGIPGGSFEPHARGSQ